MMISYEWTDWHLTPQGWIKGDYKTDFSHVSKQTTPKNRVLTRRYIESIVSVSAPMRIKRKNVWASKNIPEIKRLFRIYDYPNSLSVVSEKIFSET